jgi:ribosomal-protein-alanine N-acetyltransferase
MSESWRVRTMQKADLEAILNVQSQSDSLHWSRKDLENMLKKPQDLCLLTAVFGKIDRCINKNLVGGFLIGRCMADESELLAIAVGQKFRRQGIGNLLWGHFADFNREVGAQRCYLEVESQNKPALELYKKVGFVRSGERKNYYGPGRNAFLYSLEVV